MARDDRNAFPALSEPKASGAEFVSPTCAGIVLPSVLPARLRFGAISRAIKHGSLRRMHCPVCSGYHVLRLGIGLLLLIAAALTAHQLAREPVVATGWLDARPLQAAVMEMELLLGLWLWSGLTPLWTWRAAVGCFSVFAAVSLWKALTGAASSASFGKSRLNPPCSLAAILAILPCVLPSRPIPSRRILHDDAGRNKQVTPPPRSRSLNTSRLIQKAFEGVLGGRGVPAAVHAGRRSGLRECSR